MLCRYCRSDDRNQFELIRTLPGGVDALREVVAPPSALGGLRLAVALEDEQPGAQDRQGEQLPAPSRQVIEQDKEDTRKLPRRTTPRKAIMMVPDSDEQSKEQGA